MNVEISLTNSFFWNVFHGLCCLGYGVLNIYKWDWAKSRKTTWFYYFQLRVYGWFWVVTWTDLMCAMLWKTCFKFVTYVDVISIWVASCVVDEQLYSSYVYVKSFMTMVLWWCSTAVCVLSVFFRPHVWLPVPGSEVGVGTAGGYDSGWDKQFLACGTVVMAPKNANLCDGLRQLACNIGLPYFILYFLIRAL